MMSNLFAFRSGPSRLRRPGVGLIKSNLLALSLSGVLGGWAALGQGAAPTDVSADAAALVELQPTRPPLIPDPLPTLIVLEMGVVVSEPFEQHEDDVVDRADNLAETAVEVATPDEDIRNHPTTIPSASATARATAAPTAPRTTASGPSIASSVTQLKPPAGNTGAPVYPAAPPTTPPQPTPKPAGESAPPPPPKPAVAAEPPPPASKPTSPPPPPAAKPTSPPPPTARPTSPPPPTAAPKPPPPTAAPKPPPKPRSKSSR